MKYTVVNNKNKTTYFKKTAPALVYVKIPENATMKEQLKYLDLFNKGRSILFSEPW